MNHALKFFAPPDTEATERSGLALGAYVFRCPRCPRTPQVKADRWWQLLDDLFAPMLIAWTSLCYHEVTVAFGSQSLGEDGVTFKLDVDRPAARDT